MTQIVTFYSYKGGVGRTMALVNVAHVLARDGWRVLMVDLDLEAPGMTHFFADRVREQVTPASKDALDLLLDAKRTLPEEEREARTFKKVSLEEYVLHIPLPATWLQTEETGSPYRNGRLDLLPATLEPTLSPEPSRGYLERMDELDLSGIFSLEGPRHRFGDHLRRYFTHARFRAPGDILFTMREEVWAAYDAVLVDSRTGLNEISGLCVGPLSDALVICTALNQQNVEGTRYFMQKAGLLEKERSKPYTLVVGPVPPWHTRVAEERAMAIGKMLKAEDAVSIPYHPSAALAEMIFVLQDPRETISTAYEMLGRKLTETLAAMRRRSQPWGALATAFATAQWEDYYRETVTWLPQARLLRDEQHPKYDEAALQQFATAATMFASGGYRVRHSGVESVVIGAAISALRLKSDAPFVRAWSLRDLIKPRDLPSYRSFLIFMQLRVLGTLPRHENAAAPLKMMRDADANSPFSSSSWDAYAVIIYATDLGVTDAGLLSLHEIPIFHERWLFRDEGEWLDRLGASGAGRLMSEIIRVVMRLPSMAWLRSDFSVQLRNIRAKLRELSDKVAEELHDFGGRIAHHKLLPQTLRHYEMESSRERLLGTWPLPLMVSVMALVKGPDAIDEVLAWVNLCRLFHGYAWRVLVDWRHLAQVRTHPKFVAFMKQDDEQTEKIEAAIDRGRYPL